MTYKTPQEKKIWWAGYLIGVFIGIIIVMVISQIAR